MKIITVTNEKGGTGKTATAEALGAGLQAEGARVLYIDLDAQGSLSYILQADESKPGALEALARPGEIKQTIQTTKAGAQIIAGKRNLAEAGDILTDKKRAFRLKEGLQIIKKDYDYIIIDTPPALGLLTINALTASDGAIITAQPDILSKRGLDQLGQTIEKVKAHNKRLQIYGILLTKYDRRKTLHRQAGEQIGRKAAQLGTKTYTATIREGVAVQEAQAKRQSLLKYAPRSGAAQDYKQFIDEAKGDFEK